MKSAPAVYDLNPELRSSAQRILRLCFPCIFSKTPLHIFFWHIFIKEKFWLGIVLMNKILVKTRAVGIIMLRWLLSCSQKHVADTGEKCCGCPLMGTRWNTLLQVMHLLTEQTNSRCSFKNKGTICRLLIFELDVKAVIQVSSNSLTLHVIFLPLKCRIRFC